MRFSVVLGIALHGCTWIGPPDEVALNNLVREPIWSPADAAWGAGRTFADVDGDGYSIVVDCDDLDPGVHPRALEVCDGVDNDCDGGVDDEAAATVGGTNYQDIGLAVAAAASVAGGVVDLCAAPAPYEVGPVELTGARELTLRGGSDPADTVLTAPAGAGLFTVSGSASLSLRGLTIAAVTDGPAIRAVDTATLTLTDVVIRDGLQAVSIDGGSPGVHAQFERVQLIGNGATTGSGAGLSANGSFDVRFLDSLIDGNSATIGAGITAFKDANAVGTILLDATVLSNNVALSGGGAYLGGGASLVVSATSAVTGNQAPTNGGGAVWVDVVQGAVLVSLGADWGAAGVDDNAPNDVMVVVDYRYGIRIPYSFEGSGHSFVCGPETFSCRTEGR